MSVFINSFIIMALLLCLLFSCNPKDKDECRLEQHTGQMMAKINEEEWIGYTHGLDNNLIAIVGSYYYKPSCRLEQIISIILPGKDEGVYPLSDSMNVSSMHAEILFSFMDADLLLAHYKVEKGKISGIVEITGYNSGTEKITGNFNCTVYPYRNYGLDNPPDSLVITNGQFETIFPE